VQGIIGVAELITPFADLMVFVTRYNKTPKEFVAKLLNRYYEDKKLPQTGIVFNGIQPKRLGYYGRKYGYGYGYYSSDKVK
jgi:Mrp family chromosome partitioning ATPase